jgi:hypothetical protein
MELSNQELEDIQRVAGILGRTVDELIQLRLPRSPTPAIQDLDYLRGDDPADGNESTELF